MIKVIMNGCNGRMGQVIGKLVKENGCEIVAGIDKFPGNDNKFQMFDSIEKCNIPADVIIDFSNPSAFDGLTAYAVKNDLPLVLCTTGLSEEQITKLKNEISLKIPVFQSANMSLGVNLLVDLVKRAAKFLEGNFDIEIIEKHHNQKIDAPSGTALLIADEINSTLKEPCEYVYDRHDKTEKRGKTEIGIHSIRGGTIVGEHSVLFAGYNEVVEISHSAASREVFATGAIRAAKYLLDKKPGMYSMNDMLNGKV